MTHAILNQGNKEINRKILVTSALPYANGSLHIGHILEHIQSDIWVRFQRMQGNLCYFVCGEDAHGTPIMLKAEDRGITPEKLIAEYYAEHLKDLKDFNIHYDNYHTTHSPENQALATEIYLRLKERGDIVSKTILQAYDPIKNMFLPDRYVKGQCPKCGAMDQYGDSCESCGTTYSPTDLKNPISVLSGAPPIQKESEHYFFKLENYSDFLKNWTAGDHLQPEVSKKLKEWFESGLKSWDISRDAPYFGFKIPETEDKYFYVWLDAPVGYIASFKHFCDKNGLDFKSFWSKESEKETELYHFIGKDIVYFHALFWPAMLEGSNHRTPTGVFVHGYVTVNGQKMSKSRGTFITVRDYLKHLKPDYLRYYFASKLSNHIEDVDFQLEDFVQRVNSDLVGKLVNIASRSASFIHKYFDNKLCHENDYTIEEKGIYQEFIKKGDLIAEYYEAREYAKALREIMSLADIANRYVDEQKPWVLIKDDSKKEAHRVCSVAINLFAVLVTYLKPIVPSLAEESETFLNRQLSWEGRLKPLSQHEIQIFKPLLNRIEMSEVEQMVNNLKTEAEAAENINASASASANVNSGEALAEPFKPNISIDKFAEIDLRIAKIVKAEHVPDANKLLRLEIDLGSGVHRQIFAGIKEAYSPEDLIGKLTVVVANLEPRKMRFGLSEGMVLAAGPGGKDIFILEPHSGAEPGMRVK